MNCKEAQARAIFACQDPEGVVSSESCGVADSVGGRIKPVHGHLGVNAPGGLKSSATV